MRIFNYTLLITLALITVFISCQKEEVDPTYLDTSNQENFIAEGKILDTTIPLDPEEEFFFTEIDSFTWQVDKRTAVMEDLKVGSVFGGGFTDKFPDPYLKYIEEVREEGNNVILTVRHAGLLEAFSEFNIDIALSEEIVDPRSVSKRIAVGPQAFNLNGSGTIEIDPSIIIEYDTLKIKIDANEKDLLKELEFKVIGLETSVCVESTISGTLSGFSSSTFDIGVNFPIVIFLGPIPIEISNRVVLKLNVSANGTGSLTHKFTVGSEKLDVSMEYDGVSKFEVETNGNDINWGVDNLQSVFTDASGSINVDVGMITEYQASLYEGYSLGHLYFGVQPYGNGITAIKNSSLPHVDIDSDYIVKINAGLRGGSGIRTLIIDNSELLGGFNALDFNTTFYEERFDLQDMIVPLSCVLDTRESSMTALCDISGKSIDLSFRWDAGPSVNGKYNLKIGEQIVGSYNFNQNNSTSVNADEFDINNEIILVHEDKAGCQHRYLVNNPCLTGVNCPDGVCEKRMLDGRTWMTKNIIDSNLGACHPDDVDCQLLGRYLTYDELRNGDPDLPGFQGICPDGWHVPTLEEWRALFTAYVPIDPATSKRGIAPLLTHGLEGISEWPVNHASGFNLFPSGAQQTWQNEGEFEGSIFETGEKFIMLRSSESNSQSGTTRINPRVYNVNLKTYSFIENRTAENVALPCRCIKDQ